VGPAVTTALVVVLSIGVFVPLKYVYLSKLKVGRASSVLVACAWGVVMVAAIGFPERAGALRLVEVSLAFPIYYLGQSAWLGGWLRRAP
jgi:phosphatidylcholine synthase